MNHNRTESPLELPIFIDYRPSRRVAVFNALTHVGAVFCLFLTAMPITISVLLGIGVLLHYGIYLKRLFASEQLCFRLDRHDHWRLLRHDRDAIDLKLLAGALAHPHIIVLRFREPGGRAHACVLTHDNLDQRTLRRLRVRLRWPHK